MDKDFRGKGSELHRQVLDFCRRIAGSAQITGIGLFDSCPTGTQTVKGAVETVLVIRDFQPRLMSYVKVVDGRNIVVFAVDQWVFERDVERGFLGEASAGLMVFPYVSLSGKDYLHDQEVKLKKRLILELLENLVSGFPELSHRLRIKPEYFMYEVILNRIRVFPPLAYCTSNFMQKSSIETRPVLEGYLEALMQLEKEKRIVLDDGYVTVHKKFVAESKKPKVRLTNISRNAPRTVFTSVLEVFPQLLNFFSQSTQAILRFQKFSWKRESDATRHFVDPQKYVFVPTAEGLASLADRVNIEIFAKKMLVNGEGQVKLEAIGGVLNDIYLIKARSNGKEKKVLVKRFKDWSGFKWFPLTLWSLGARAFAVSGRSRLERECSISELLRGEGFSVPKVLHVSHNERMIFMEYVEGENLSKAIKRIATAKTIDKMENDLSTIAQVGEIFAHVHSINVALGDTKPENVIVDPNGKIYLLDFEQAVQDGDKSWDVAEFLYYAGHDLPPLHSNGKAQSIANAFISGYVKAGGDIGVIRRAGAPKYTRVFSVFTMPSVILAISDACKKAKASREEKHG